MIEKAVNFFSNLTATDIIASVGLVTSVVALTWNIIRDLIRDRVRIEVMVQFGGLLHFNDSKNSAIFMKEGSLKNKEPRNRQLAFFITNTGRRPIVIKEIGAKFKRRHMKKHPDEAVLQIASVVLPKTLQPYEYAYCPTDHFSDVIQEIEKSNLDYFYAMDTKNQIWKAPKEQLKEVLKNYKAYKTKPNNENSSC